MRFGLISGLKMVVVLAVLLWGRTGVAVAGDHDLPEVTVIVNDSTNVSSSVLAQAELETTRIFRGAGLEIAWVNCRGGSGASEACRRVPGVNEFVVHIVATGRRSKDSVFGEAFLGPDGSGKYCDVFLDRIEEERRQSGIRVPVLLGAVAAHELGHLLLGSHAHSWLGLMTPLWNKEILGQMEMGNLFFTRDQSLLMKARMGQRETKIARAGD